MRRTPKEIIMMPIILDIVKFSENKKYPIIAVNT